MLVIVFFFLQTISGVVYHDSNVLENVILKSNNEIITRTNSLGQFSFKLNNEMKNVSFELKGFNTLSIESEKLNQSMIIYLNRVSLFTSDTLVLSATKPNKFQKVSTLSSISQRKLISTTLSKETIKRSLTSAPEIHVQESSGHGAAPVYKGFRANKLLYTIDGIRFNNAFFKSGNTPYMSLLNPLYFNSISIAEGAVSIAYGSDAIGGSINFSNTRNDADSIRFISQFSSADNTLSYGANYKLSMNNSSHFLALYKRDAGNRTVGKDGPNSIKNLRIQETQYQQQNIDYSYQFSAENSDLEMSFHIAEQSNASDFYRTYYKGSNSYEYDPLFWLMTKLSYDYYITRSSDLNLTLYYQRFQEKKKESADGDNIINDDNISIYGFNSNYINRFADIKMMSGVDLIYERSETDAEKNESEIVSKYPDNATQLQSALFSTLVKPLFKNSQVTVGARASYTKSDIPAQNSFILGLAKLKAYDKTFNSFIYNIGFKHFYKNNSFQLNYSTAFRSPNFDDLAKTGEIKKSVIFLPNYEINSEKSKNIQFNYSHINETNRIDFGFFFNQMEDLIEANKTYYNAQENITIDGDVFSFEHNENIGKAEMYGFNVNYILDLPAFHLQTGIAYQIGENLITKKPLSKIPALKVNFSFLYRFNESLNSGLNYIYTDKQTRLSNSDLSDPRFIASGTPEFMRFDIFTSYNFGNYEIELEIENLLNKLYRIHGSALNGRGRSLNMSVGLAW